MFNRVYLIKFSCLLTKIILSSCKVGPTHTLEMKDRLFFIAYWIVQKYKILCRTEHNVKLVIESKS